MFNVSNKKAISKLSRESFKGNKTRNIIAIIAIALTAMMFTALFTISGGVIENIQKQTMRQAGGDGMAVVKYITDEEYNNIKDHKLIKEISYNRAICDDVYNIELIKRRAEVYYMDDIGMKLGFIELSGGHKPKKVNEIIMDTTAIEMLGIKKEVGSKVNLTMNVHNKKVKREFVLCGWWEADPVFNVSIMVTSRSYVDKYIDELYNLYDANGSLTGAINSYIMFDNSFNIEGKLEKVITESGYSLNENDKNFVESNVNWSYMSSNFDPISATIVILVILLIVLTGYLIIYNIFQISVINDVRFYGLLKTIGTTSKQIKKIIKKQAFMLSLIGIPIGLIFGYFIGTKFVPIFMSSITNSSGYEYHTSANPIVFLLSGIFTFITVRISTKKPSRIASKISPVETVKYTENASNYKRKKNKKNSAKISSMARSNLGRNKKKTVIMIISMALSIVLVTVVYSLSISFDMDKYLSTFVDTDFIIGHADYFNYNYRGPENEVSKSFIEYVNSLDGFEEGGKIYANIRDVECFSVEDKENKKDFNLAYDKNHMSAVYGMDNLPLKRLKVIEGEIDYEKLKTGDYILEGVKLDDNHNPIKEDSHFNVGDSVVLHNYKGKSNNIDKRKYTTRKFKIMAKVEMNNYTNTCMSWFEYSYYLPSSVYKTMVENPGVMSYSFNVRDDKEEKAEKVILNYTQNNEKLMNYSSKGTHVREFEDLKNTLIMVGGLLSLVVGIVGILNFFNSMLTSIITRKREFAILQSIGMTNAQLKKMLVYEGFYYVFYVCLFGGIFSIIFSLTVVKALANLFWFTTYKFTVLPIFLMIPLFFIIGLILPFVMSSIVNRQSIVERLRVE